MNSKKDDQWISDNLDTSKDRILFERDEVLLAMKAVRQGILARAKTIYSSKGSSLHDPGAMIRFLIDEIERG